MIEQAAHFAGTIPENYDSGLGPHLFVDFAADLAHRAVAAKPGRVLETAAGTGITGIRCHQRQSGRALCC